MASSRRGEKARGGSTRRPVRAGLDGLATDEKSMAAWQSVWFELREHSWSSLAIVPAGEIALTLEVAEALATIGGRFERSGVKAVDARGVGLDDCRILVEAIRSTTRPRDRLIVAVDDPRSTPTTVPIVRAADGAVLLVSLESTFLREARAVLGRLGEGCFIGSMALRAQKRRRRKAGSKGTTAGPREPSWSDFAAIEQDEAPCVTAAGKEPP